MYYNKFANEYHHHHHHYHAHLGLDWHRFMYKAGMWILMASNILTGLSALMVSMYAYYLNTAFMLMFMAIVMIGLGVACIPVQARLHYRRRGTPDQLLALQIASAVVAELTMCLITGFVTMSMIFGITLAIINRCYYGKRIRMFKY